MLDTFTKSEMTKLVARNYPHIKYPPVVMAQVTAMSKVGDRVWQYSLKPLKSDRSASDLPEIPNIRSHIEVEAGVGGIVAIALLYGQVRPVIIDEVFL